MGLFKKDEKGDDCSINPDGTERCRVFKANAKNKEAIATGTDYTFGMDENCRAFFTGNSVRIMDEDKERVKEKLTERETFCRRGFA